MKNLNRKIKNPTFVHIDIEHMEKDWILIYSNNQDFTIELAKGILTENEVDFVVIDKKDKFYRFGDFEIYVHRDNAIKAKFLLKELDN